jgi:hypothetical protein
MALKFASKVISHPATKYPPSAVWTASTSSDGYVVEIVIGHSGMAETFTFKRENFIVEAITVSSA